MSGYKTRSSTEVVLEQPVPIPVYRGPNSSRRYAELGITATIPSSGLSRAKYDTIGKASSSAVSTKTDLHIARHSFAHISL